jgi:transketolase N-terminal domain/subunit
MSYRSWLLQSLIRIGQGRAEYRECGWCTKRLLSAANTIHFHGDTRQSEVGSEKRRSRGFGAVYTLETLTACDTYTMAQETFPIDLGKLKPLKLDPAVTALSEEDKGTLRYNIQLCRDAIVFFTALAGAKGLSGHTGGAYDTVPEVTIIRAFIAQGAPIVPVFYDEAGHRVATQYLLSVLNGAMPPERLLHYREYQSGLPGHPEKMLTPGVEFSSGRLGHTWAFCNGVALANPGKAVVLLGSDGSQMEGDNAEAARLSVGKQLNIKLLIDDNNVTIAGHPQDYMPGYDLTRTLSGYGLTTETTMGEDLDALYIDLCRVFNNPLPHALVIKRPMAPGIAGAEGSPHAHEVLSRKARRLYGRDRDAQGGQAREEPADLSRLLGSRQEPRRLRQVDQRNARWHGRGQESCDRARVRQRPRGILRPAPYPQEIPAGVRTGRHHGTRQLLRGGRLRFVTGQAGHLRHFQRLP